LGVSQLEKVALRLFARTREKGHIGPARGTEIPRPRRRS
jgi:hypothetical protein